MPEENDVSNDITVTIKNCNNIDESQISIKKSALNIKYAINGTGKSSIAKAIDYFSKDQNSNSNSLKQLKPFKYLGQEGNDPEVRGIEALKDVKIFNEAYVADIVFRPKELIEGSFDIFIRNETYEEGLKKIDKLVVSIQKTFAENEDIVSLIEDLKELSNSFGRPTKTGIYASSVISKALKGGNKVVNIPSELSGYGEYIRHDENCNWIKWQMDGQAYLDITENCPYCISNIKEKRKAINQISEVYDSKSVQNLKKIINTFHKLTKYFSKDTQIKITEFIKNTKGYTDEEIKYLREIREQSDGLNKKFINLHDLGFVSLKDVGKVIETLNLYKIDLNFYNHLKSDSTQKMVDIVNNSIDRTLKQVGDLQGQINQQKYLIERLIREHKTEINAFLKNAGYEYQVDLIENTESQYYLKLIHNDMQDEVDNVKSHLSFGERNAFALVLFMYDVLKNPPDLIILDDPISSFDKNKKYAIIDMLFRKGKGLNGKTVLLLTHDFEPIIDMVHHHSDRFDIPTATFLENAHGHLVEKKIKRENIQTFVDINKSNIENMTNNIITRLVYLRRLYEVKNARGCGYQLISNLLHKRAKPKFKDETGLRDMTTDEIKLGSDEIRAWISDFDYERILEIVKDDEQMKIIYSSTESNYEKLHMYRIIFDNRIDEIESNVIQKFINEALHIENDYIYQLNPCDYQLVPQFVIDECDKSINNLNLPTHQPERSEG
jgi:energy-coupling factor transporter ATP-binding protein EcfA2